MGERKYCPYCGREVDPSWKACPYCGHSFEIKEKKRIDKRLVRFIFSAIMSAVFVITAVVMIFEAHQMQVMFSYLYGELGAPSLMGGYLNTLLLILVVSVLLSTIMAGLGLVAVGISYDDNKKVVLSLGFYIASLLFAVTAFGISIFTTLMITAGASNPENNTQIVSVQKALTIGYNFQYTALAYVAISAILLFAIFLQYSEESKRKSERT